jgi:acyl-coenzyme A synthetase/AMP-(fatty) acid ligase/acyl carrier protein
VGRYIANLGLSGDDRLSLLSGYGYDAAVQDVFGTLLSGARLYPLDVRTNTDAGALVEVLGESQVTVVHATPTVYRHLFGGELNCSHDLSAVRLVVLGGEVARRSDFELYRSRFARGTQFVNGYGLTESTMGLQFFADHDTRLLGQQVPVGQPVGDIEVELFDTNGEVSWLGEIRLRGPGVFAGYWNTNVEAAGPDASPVTTDGWYCTGDFGRRLPDGQVLYTGRRDARLKIRGQRVEPAEIEAALNALADVRESVVCVVAHPGAEAQLVGYVVTASAPAAEVIDAWRRSLAEALPRTMVPQAIEWLNELPRRSNGKVATELLPAPGTVARRIAVPPRTELELVLTGLWRELLPVDELGIHDDFFALGGHSLLATRLIARIRDRLGIEVPLVGLFEGPTIAKLADAIEAGGELTPAIMIAPGRGGSSRATGLD